MEVVVRDLGVKNHHKMISVKIMQLFVHHPTGENGVCRWGRSNLRFQRCLCVERRGGKPPEELQVQAVEAQSKAAITCITLPQLLQAWHS